MTYFVNRVRSVVGAVTVAAMVACFATPASAQGSVRIGTSSLGSALYSLAVGVSQIMRNHAGINSNVQVVGGSSANMFAIESNKVDFAIANELAAYDAYHGIKPFKHKVKLYEVVQAEHSYRIVFASKTSGIRTPADLRGKRIVGIRPALPEVAEITDAMLKVYGIPKSAVTIVSTTTSGEALKALKSGSVDAVVLPASPHAPNVSSLAQQMPLVFLSFPKDKLHAMLKMLPPALSASVIPKGMYKGMTGDVHTIGVGTVFVAAARVSKDVVYKTAKAIFEHTNELATMQSSGKEWTVKNTLADPKLPLDPGVIRYFKEMGVWTARDQKIQNMLAAR